MERRRKQEYDRYIHSEVWREKRRLAFAHYGRRCARKDCAATTKLHVHHLTYARFGGGELVEDLMVLCEDCHNDLHCLNVKPKPRRPKRRKKKRARSSQTTPRKKRPEPSTSDLLKRMVAQKKRARVVRR